MEDFIRIHDVRMKRLNASNTILLFLNLEQSVLYLHNAKGTFEYYLSDSRETLHWSSLLQSHQCTPLSRTHSVTDY